ncbi:hypothetical protein GCM10009665_02890 [Kitasatospora nipponensis]|uniref:Secreted protein n=1 Tax=Kitasatospora nipponensis TaxID=258049 RepID=A0ABN1VLP7_9ACTN
MEAIGALGVLLVLFGIGAVTLVVLAILRTGRALAAKVERTEVQARRAVENVTLRARTYTRPGAQGEIAAVRLALRTSLTGTREVLQGAVASDGQLTEALQLLGRLDAHAAELDGELRMLEREPEQSRLAVKLPELRERAERITSSAESMRWAAQDRMHRFAQDELSRLSEECASEAGALRHWDTGAADPASGAGAGASGGAAVGDPVVGDPVSGAGRPGLAAAGRLSAEEALKLGEPLTRLAGRLRKPNPGSSAG